MNQFTTPVHPFRFFVLLAAFVWPASCSVSLAASGAPDPRREGWPSEALSAVADDQLSRLGQLIVQSKTPTAEQLAKLELIARQFSWQPLRPEDQTRVFHSKQISVWRGATGKDAKARMHGEAGLAEALKGVRESLKGAHDVRCKFKIHQVDMQDRSRPAMRVYVALAGRTNRGLIEQNADWIVSWEHRATDSSLRLRSIEIEAFEEVRTRTNEGHPLFRDCTTSVFQSTDSFRQQLAYSHAYWRKRIENFHVIHKSAQNGLTVGDVNGDGLDDVYVCQPGGLPNRLYLHQSDGSVRDVSAASGSDILDNTRSALLIDFDNDGDQDMVLAVTSALLLFQNDGRGHFTPIKAIPAIVDAYTLAAADFDNDGDLDIFACRYFPTGANIQALPIPTPYFDAENGGRNFLVRNDGNWRTSNATFETGLDANNNRFSYAAIWIDYDRDGDQDLYVANDFGRNNLYRNDLGADGKRRFTDVATALDMQDGAFGMSACGGDFNRDGYEDIYVGNMFSAAGSRVTRQPEFKAGTSNERLAQFQHLARGNSLFQNMQGRRFRDVSVQSGVTLGRWSWGCVFADINNDGWEDLLVANGYITGDDPEDDL